MQAEVPVSDLNLCLHILLQLFHEILYFHKVKKYKEAARSVRYSMRLGLIKLTLPPKIQHKPPRTETPALFHTTQ